MQNIDRNNVDDVLKQRRTVMLFASMLILQLPIASCIIIESGSNHYFPARFLLIPGYRGRRTHLQGVTGEVCLLVSPHALGRHDQHHHPEDEEHRQPHLPQAGGIAVDPAQLGQQGPPRRHASAGGDHQTRQLVQGGSLFRVRTTRKSSS